MATHNMEMDRLLQTVRIRVPGVTDAAIQVELFNTVDEHLRRTNAWRWESVVGLTAGIIQYPIFPPAGAAMVRVIGASFKDLPLLPTSTSSVQAQSQLARLTADQIFPDADAEFDADVVGTPGGVFTYSIFYPTFITLDVPPSSEAADFPVKLLLALTLDPQQIEEEPHEWALEEWMFARYFADWLNGTLAKLYAHINKPYSNPPMASYHERKFRQSMAFAKQEASRGFIHNQPNWRFPSFA